MDVAGDHIRDLFSSFLQSYSPEDSAFEDDYSTSYYQTQIIDMLNIERTTLFVNFADLIAFDKDLAAAIEQNYYRFDPFLRRGLSEAVKRTKIKAIELERQDKARQRALDAWQQGTAEESLNMLAEAEAPKVDDTIMYFVAFFNLPSRIRIRGMRTHTIGKLVTICGTVTRSSEVRPELLYGAFICTTCATKQLNVDQQFQYTPPHTCVNPLCSKGSFHLLIEESSLVNWQRLRVQENADEIPAGSMPRCIDIICRNDIVEIAKAGDKMLFTGAAAVIPDAAKVGETTTGVKSFAGRGEGVGEGVGGLKAMGVRDFNYKMLFVACSVQSFHGSESGSTRVVSINELRGIETSADNAEMTEEEQEEIIRMRNTAQLYAKMSDSICPTVHGHSEVKRGVLLMMLGGVHKTTHEGINLRGDINVCIVGDPSCAKSQFLKYVHRFLPRSIYTSGKSSSAAGLTASVVRDAETGEYCIEAGALMLADNGICCIDEFDKMESSDQVAIHEAMEQQTISITKAGIQATLNARASILAAANPVFGRYDRSKPLKANVAVSAPIMSRFDLFFIIVDESNPELDEAIARHIVSVHQAGGKQRAADAAPFSTEQMQRYIRFARTINPRFTPASQKKIVESYRLLRQQDILGSGRTAYRITVRQLESLIRLSEALARLHLDANVQPTYVLEALRLLQKSIIFVESADVPLEDIDAEDQSGGDDDDDANDGTGYPNDESGYAGADDGGNGGSEAHVESRAEAVTADEDAEVAESPTKKPKIEQDVKPKLEKRVKPKVSREEYDKVTQFIVLYLKKKEAAEDGAECKGCLWKDIMSAYFLMNSDEGAASEEQQKTVHLIIRRMTKVDGVLMQVGEYEDGVPNEERSLRLHPSHQDEI